MNSWRKPGQMRNFIFFTILNVVFLFPFTSNAQGLVINEVMSVNDNTIADEDGDYEDWIELYNGTNEIINLSGYNLSDKVGQPAKWTFTDYLFEPGAYLLVFASGKDRHTLPYFHTNFSIKAEGENVLLSNPQGEIISHYNAVSLTENNSYGCRMDGFLNNIIFFKGSTPGNTNNFQQELGIKDSLTFSNPQGFYTSNFNLTITHNRPEATIRYTLNGSDPTPLSPVFISSLLIKNRENDPNGISMIPTNPLDLPYREFVWKEPQNNVLKAITLKVRSFIDTVAVSDIFTRTYIVHPDIFSRYPNFAVASLVTDSLCLFDYATGIYIPGLYHDLNPTWPTWTGTGNYCERGDEWERPANLTLFESDGSLAFQQNVGIRIHGGGTRVYPEKSLRIYARDTYGQSNINYKLFPEKDIYKYKHFLLHNNSQDFLYAIINDIVAYYVVRKMNVEIQSYRPSVLFINGEFWGIHSIRDRLDKYYLEYTRNIDPENIDILENHLEVEEGDTLQYTAMLDYLKNHDITQQVVYDSVSSMIDIDNFIDYNICKQYLSTGDWPGNNVSCWKERSPGHKWRWMVYDNNYAFLGYDENTIQISTEAGGTSWPNPDWSTFLLRTLLQNETFKQQYLQKFEYHLLNTFRSEKVLHYIDSLAALVLPILPEQISRWNYPQDLGYWQFYVDEMKDFASKRGCFLRQVLIEHFNIADSTYAEEACLSNIPKLTKDIVKIYIADNMIHVNMPMELQGDIYIHNILGQQIQHQLVGKQDNYQFPINGVKGCYIVRIIVKGDSYSQKIVF